MLRVVGQQCCKCLHIAKHLTGFKLCTTTSDTMQQLQVIQTDATCNIQQCWELLSNYFASVCMQLKMIYVAHVWYINMTPRLSGHIYKCGLLVFGIKSLLGFARRWSHEKLAILSLKPLIYQTWTIFFTRSPNIFYDKTGVTNQCLRCVNRTDLAVSLQVKKKTLRCIVDENLRIPTIFFQIKTHSDQINYLTCKTMLIENNVLKCNLIL